jgi:hypothetical protein
MTDKIPQNTPELLSGIEREWKELWRVAGHLTPEQMTASDAGGWSPKDNLAHLAEWMKILMGYHMDRCPAHEVMGVPIGVTRDWDMDVINPVLFERNRLRSTDDVLGEIKRVYSALMLKLRSMPFEDLMQPRHADDPERQPLLNWILGNTTQHFAEHRATIEKLL